MQPYELDAWLGDTDVTDDQRHQIYAAAERIDQHWPHDDDADDRETALAAAIQVLLGDDTLEAIGRARTEARRAYLAAAAALTGAIIASAGAGVPETQIAARAQIDRQPVRRALGK